MATTHHNSLQATIKPSLVVQMKPPFTNRQRLEKHDQPSVRHFFVQAATLKSRLSHVSSPARCHKHHTTICRRASNIRGCRGHPLFAPIMSSASAAGLGSDELICSVCLDLLNDPVTLGCGHSFCLECVNQYWACRGGTSTYICPNCREVFPQKPQLKKNVIIASMVTQMNLGVEEQAKRPICPDHGKLIQLYCKDDDSLMCFMCMTVKHQQHKVVAVEVAHAELKDSLTAQSAQVEESKKHLESNLLQLRQKHANGEGSAGDGTAALERKRDELYELVDKTVEVMKKRLLERERLECVLFEKHILEVEQKLERVQETELSLKEALQEAQAVAFLQDHKDVQCRLDSVRDIQHTLPDVLDFSKEQHEMDSLIQLNKTFLKEIHTLPLIKDGKASIPGISGLSPNSLRSLYGRTPTLDHNSAHPNLLLSKDLKMATKTSSVQPHPDHPLRFDFYTQVLTTESFSSGRHYWEVDISRTNRCEIGAVYDSISRKGYGSECSLGGNLASWCVRKWDGKYAAWHNGKRVLLNLMASPSRLGLCLDYEAGELVCYGDDTGLLHTFKATFNQPLLPALSLGAGSASFCLLW